MAAASGQRCACALGPGAAGGRRAKWGRGACWSSVELLQPRQPPPPPPQRRGHVVWCVGRGEEEEGVKPREETGETPHTHGTRWPERQQHPELSDVLPRPRCPLAGGELYSGGPETRRNWVAVAEARRASHACRSSWPRRPGLPGPRRRKLGCGSGHGGAPGPGRLDRAWAGGSGGWSVPVSKMETRRCQWPSYTRLLTEFKINLLMV
nr:uncharacterized protein LOC114107909 [Marmota flaviventris]